MVHLPSQAVLVRVLSLSVLQVAVLNAIITGIDGSLSTVSTWVVEVRLLRTPARCYGS